MAPRTRKTTAPAAPAATAAPDDCVEVPDDLDQDVALELEDDDE